MEDKTIVVFGIIVIIFFLIAEFIGRSKHIGRGWTFFLLLAGIIPGLFALASSPSANKEPTKGNTAHKVFGILLVIFGFGNLFFIAEMPGGINNPSVSVIPAFILLGNYLIRLSTGKIVNHNPKFYFGSKIRYQRPTDPKEPMPQNTKESNHGFSYSKNLENLKNLRENGILTESEYNNKISELKFQAVYEQLKKSSDYQRLNELFLNGLLTKIEFDSKVQMLYSNFIAIQNQSNLSESLIVFTDTDLNYGFKDRYGNVIIKPTYEFADDFSEGLALVRMARRFGFIDEQDKIKIAFLYDNAESFKNGKAFVRINRNEFYIDKNGNRIY